MPNRPKRDPELSFRRPADGCLVEAWTTKHRLRSRDRVLDGTTYYRLLAAVDGSVIAYYTSRFPDPEKALAYLRRLFPSIEQSDGPAPTMPS